MFKCARCNIITRTVTKELVATDSQNNSFNLSSQTVNQIFGNSVMQSDACVSNLFGKNLSPIYERRMINQNVINNQNNSNMNINNPFLTPKSNISTFDIGTHSPMDKITIDEFNKLNVNNNGNENEMTGNDNQKVSSVAILDKEIFEHVENNLEDIEKLVYLCVDYKKRIVEEDEFESGNRKLLNLGHTTAHGIEKLSGYTIAHGKAVAMGLNLMLKASFKHGYIDEKLYSELIKTIEKCVGTQENPYAIEDVCKASLSDKKRSGDIISIVTVHGVGDCRVEKINVNDMVEFLK